jgi:CubicO group peptidase (beta-lactamase class C family)
MRQMHSFRSVLVFITIIPAALTPACAGRAAHAPEYVGVTSGGASPVATALRDTIQRVLDRALSDSAFPGAFAIVGTHAEVLAQSGVGRLDWAPGPAPDEHTLWDLASLTKVVGMTTAVMQLTERGLIDLDAPLQRYFPEWTGPNKQAVTIRQLITHTSGLPAFRAYDQITMDPDSLAKLMFGTQLDTMPGARMVYSDIGAYMLGRLVERVSRKPLDRYVNDRVFEPLKMSETMYRPGLSLVSRIAPTEVDPRRGGLVRGVVHDERAYYLGGVSAHAGLFSSGHDLARFARMYLNGGTLDGAVIVQPGTIAQFTAWQVADRALGWQKPDGSNSAGHFMSPQAFGHTGFTGTSIWIDPNHDVFIILLSNRVNPSRANTRIVRVRVALADAVMATLEHLQLSAPAERP